MEVDITMMSKSARALNSLELQDLVDFIESYNSTYNCTDFGIKCMEKVNINLTDSFGSWPGGGGSNPGDLGAGY